MTIWKLKSGHDRRFRSGHPWVYSNELTESPKGIEPGEAIELRDASGKFLARGFGNPSSLIAFRAVSRDPDETEPLSGEGFSRRLKSAYRLREVLGLKDLSFRLAYGEADFLPGLVIDRYLLAKGEQVFVIQAHSAGMDRKIDEVMGALEKLVTSEELGKWDRTAIQLRNDIGFRKLEGLEDQESRTVKPLKSHPLSNAVIRVPGATPGSVSEFNVDLESGQKTGFFLDQWANVQLATQRFARIRPKGKSLRILDLCCYVGQWSTKLSSHFISQGMSVEVGLVDSSKDALALAEKNVKSTGADCVTMKGDVLRDLESLDEGEFDLVIADPPALIKGRKDIPTGTHAYLQLNTQAIRLLRKGGGLISCSCSALLEEDAFMATLSKAAYRNGTRMSWIGRGAQSPDHPMLAEFPEGRYLKAWIGISKD